MILRQATEMLWTGIATVKLEPRGRDTTTITVTHFKLLPGILEESGSIIRPL